MQLTKRGIFTGMVTVIFLGNLFLISLVAYWLVRPYQLPVVEVPIEILNTNNVIAVGEPIEMLIKIDKPVELEPNTTKLIVCDSGNLITLTSSTRNLPVGQYEITSNTTLLPAKILDGDTCNFKFVVEYHLNPIRTETQTWYSENFKVIESR